MKGRPPKATEVLEMTGAFARNPARGAARRAAEAELQPLGPPPRHWICKPGHPDLDKNKALRKIWKEVSDLVPGMASRSRFLLEDFCVLRYQLRTGVVKAGEMNQSRLLGGALGLDGKGRVNPQLKKAGELIDPRDAFEQHTPTRPPAS
jgi:hypothetical protein